MKTKLFAFLFLLTLGGGAHAATLSGTAQAAVLGKKITTAYTAEDYAKTKKLFMEYDQLDTTMPPPLMLVRARFHYDIGEFFAAYLILVDYLNIAPPDSPDYDTALEMYVGLEAKPEVTALRKAAALIEENRRFTVAFGHDASPDATSADGITDLHYAALGNMSGLVKFLLDAGAIVNAKGADGYTPLHYAVSAPTNANAREVAELLLDRGADVNAKDKDGRTPLYHAAWVNAREVAELLITHGADVNAKDEDGRTPRDIAESEGHSELAQLLR